MSAGGVSARVSSTAAKSEVDEFGRAVAGHEHVADLQVAVGHRAFEGVLQAAGDVDHQPDGLGRFDLFADLDELPQVAALDELHDEEMGSVRPRRPRRCGTMFS